MRVDLTFLDHAKSCGFTIREEDGGFPLIYLNAGRRKSKYLVISYDDSGVLCLTLSPDPAKMRQPRQYSLITNHELYFHMSEASRVLENLQCWRVPGEQCKLPFQFWLDSGKKFPLADGYGTIDAMLAFGRVFPTAQLTDYEYERNQLILSRLNEQDLSQIVARIKRCPPFGDDDAATIGKLIIGLHWDLKVLLPACGIGEKACAKS